MRSIYPACKAVGLLLCTLLLCLRHSPALNLAVFALCAIGLLTARVPLRKLALSILPILVAAVGTFFTGYYFAAGSSSVNAQTLNLLGSRVYNGLVLSSRVVAFAGLGFLLAYTTDKVRLVQSLQQHFRLPAVFCYGLLAAWGIFPNMATEYRKARAAFAARGVRVSALSPALLRPLLVKTVRWSEALAVAMESKGFTAGRPRKPYRPLVLRPVDVLFPILSTAAMLAAVLLVPA